MLLVFFSTDVSELPGSHAYGACIIDASEVAGTHVVGFLVSHVSKLPVAYTKMRAVSLADSHQNVNFCLYVD